MQKFCKILSLLARRTIGRQSGQLECFKDIFNGYFNAKWDRKEF